MNKVYSFVRKWSLIWLSTVESYYERRAIIYLMCLSPEQISTKLAGISGNPLEGFRFKRYLF